MTYLGAPEDPTDVRVDQLEEGTRIESWLFDGSCNTLVVQLVRPTPRGGRVRIDATNFNNGETITRFLRPDRLISASGKL